MKYYILSIESYVNAFSYADAAKEIRYSFEKLGNSFSAEFYAAGDKFLVYKRKPQGCVNMLLELVKVSGTTLVFKKLIELNKSISLEPFSIAYDLEQEDFIEVTEEVFTLVYERLLKGIETSDPKELSMKGPRVTGAENVLLYGVPGVGKSYTIQQRYCNDEKRMERVVFHPDYTYSDFIGQILPRVENGQLKYVFSPGPFTKLLKKAWDNPEEEFYLVIEEINRGNAPAIFGEVFQLLDRKSKDSNKYADTEIGESEYGITNYDVATIVYDGNSEHEVRIPSNMWVLATMNTADQNVFTLDTAFQRRWNMHQIKNDVMSAKHAKQKIEGTAIGWGSFATVINDMVVEVSVDMASSEDKRLGAYFVRCNELAADKFPEKVLKYLWDDAFKMDKEAVFDEKYRSLEAVIEAYESTETDRLKAVLRADVYNKMLSSMALGTEE